MTCRSFREGSGARRQNSSPKSHAKERRAKFPTQAPIGPDSGERRDRHREVKNCHEFKSSLGGHKGAARAWQKEWFRVVASNPFPPSRRCFRRAGPAWGAVAAYAAARLAGASERAASFSQRQQQRHRAEGSGGCGGGQARRRPAVSSSTGSQDGGQAADPDGQREAQQEHHAARERRQDLGRGVASGRVSPSQGGRRGGCRGGAGAGAVGEGAAGLTWWLFSPRRGTRPRRRRRWGRGSWPSSSSWSAGRVSEGTSWWPPEKEGELRRMCLSPLSSLWKKPVPFSLHRYLVSATPPFEEPGAMRVALSLPHFI